ncbi:MAG: hypothetical protein KDD98_10810 [Sphingomonadaceae bacterium]|nr:hypothetical protein [Sphingomonadaceae bacterium]
MKNLATALLATALALPVSGCITLKATPHDFGCGGRLETYASTYPDTPLFAAIRRDAGQDFHDREPDTHGFGGEASLKPDLQQVLAQALVESADNENLRDPDAAPAMLLLSGGGGWGAFGAGFMQAWSHDSDAPMPRLAAVTGISTGALQGLFVASGRIDDMADTYAIQQQSELANER